MAHIDVRLKILAAGLISLVLASSHSKVCLSAGLILAVVYCLLGRLDISWMLKRLLSLNLFILFLWLTIPLARTSSPPVITFGWFSLYQEGINLALVVTMKSNAIMLFLMPLIGTLSIPELSRGLLHLGVPVRLVQLLGATYRYVAVLQEEYQRLHQAALLRGFAPATNLHTYRTYGYLVAMTLLRSKIRAERVHKAMLMRGFTGSYPILDPEIPPKPWETPLPLFLFGGTLLILITLSVFR